jgi:hypothetical protein
LVAYHNPAQSFNAAIGEAFDNALAVIESGSALSLLEKWVAWTQGV